MAHVVVLNGTEEKKDGPPHTMRRLFFSTASLEVLSRLIRKICGLSNRGGEIENDKERNSEVAWR